MASSRKPRIAVVGAGVIGLSVSLCLTETYGQQLDLTIIADKFSPDTTSDHAGGLILPGGNYIPAGGSLFEKDSEQWATDTFHRLCHIHKMYGEDVTGIQITSGYKFYKEKQATPWIKHLLFEFKELNKPEAKALDLPCQRFETIWAFRTFMIRGETYLPWMMRKIQDNGGLIVQHKVESLLELSGYDIIINCTGLGAHHLVGDKSLFPVRGQIVVVKAPWMKTVYYNREPDLSDVVYILPRQDVVLLGGTAQPNNWSTTPDPKTAQKIYQDCLKLAPELKGAEVIGGWACLRPVRERVRLEVETPLSGPPVIHNYGHGGQGVILSWGCAIQTMNLMRDHLVKKGLLMNPESNL